MGKAGRVCKIAVGYPVFMTFRIVCFFYWRLHTQYENIPTMIPRFIVLCLVLTVVPPRMVLAGEEVPGPVRAEVVRVLDGDTIEISAQVWLGLRLTSHVRIRGIDTPELRGACASEKVMAAQARDRLAHLAGATISIAHIADDKYAGRVLADATAANGTDLKEAMLASGLARPYDGAARGDWCAVGSIR